MEMVTFEPCMYKMFGLMSQVAENMSDLKLRDIFAMNAMNGILNDNMRTAVDDILRNDEKDKDFWTERIAAASYKMADAMLQARKKKS